MNARKTPQNALLLFLATLPAAGCQTTPYEPSEPAVRTIEVQVATPVPCPALVELGPEPAYPDTAEALAAAPDIGALASLYAQGRLLRMQRLAEYTAAKTGCIF